MGCKYADNRCPKMRAQLRKQIANRDIAGAVRTAAQGVAMIVSSAISGKVVIQPPATPSRNVASSNQQRREMNKILRNQAGNND